MTRLSTRFAHVVALTALTLSVSCAVAQQNVPAAPAAAPSGPAPAASAPVFPKPDPANFTASAPTKETINAFLQASWGYDPTRVWQVQAIMKTPTEGVSKVVVLVGSTTGQMQTAMLQFYAMPDGKHAIAGSDMVPFGSNPFAENRAILQQRADGPFRGSASKDLEIVEFADYECPHCKEAQATIEKLVTDFPKAHIAYQQFPLSKIHPQADKASAYAVCVNKLGGSSAFFRFSSALYEGQNGLATADGATMTLNSAVTSVGLDPSKVGACAATAETKAQVDASVKLAGDLNINETPMLMINGRAVPATGVTYDVLKKIIEYQAKIDGISLQ